MWLTLLLRNNSQNFNFSFSFICLFFLLLRSFKLQQIQLIKSNSVSSRHSQSYLHGWNRQWYFNLSSPDFIFINGKERNSVKTQARDTWMFSFRVSSNKKFELAIMKIMLLQVCLLSVCVECALIKSSFLNFKVPSGYLHSSFSSCCRIWVIFPADNAHTNP